MRSISPIHELTDVVWGGGYTNYLQKKIKPTQNFSFRFSLSNTHFALCFFFFIPKLPFFMLFQLTNDDMRKLRERGKKKSKLSKNLVIFFVHSFLSSWTNFSSSNLFFAAALPGFPSWLQLYKSGTQKSFQNKIIINSPPNSSRIQLATSPSSRIFLDLFSLSLSLSLSLFKEDFANLLL